PAQPEKVTLVCSNKPRPSVHSNRRFAAETRDVHHFRKGAAADHITLCGLDAEDWLCLGEDTLPQALETPGLCRKCAARAQATPPSPAPSVKPDSHITGIIATMESYVEGTVGRAFSRHDIKSVLAYIKSLQV